MIENNYLIEGEKFSLTERDVVTPISFSDNEINEKYKKGEMRIVTEQGRIDLHSIVNILDSKQGDSKKYILNPEYQRRRRWDNRKKSFGW